jgi:glutaredoxin
MTFGSKHTLALALLLCSVAASAQVFKWVDANGKTHYSDKPPPATAKQAQVTNASTGVSTEGMPYTLAQAVRSAPVTLWTTSPCAGCDSGRSLLKARGIPFAEKTVKTAEDEQALKAAGGDGLPMLVVGASKTNGYLQSQWESMLDVARYPSAKMLPASYRYPDPVAAVPVAAPAAAGTERASPRASKAETDAKRERAAAEARKQRTAPPGFVF